MSIPDAATIPLSAQTTVGAAHLTVAELERSIAEYERAIGLRVLGREDGVVRLGAGARELLVLAEEPGARPAPGHTGLFHFALLVPTRADLARWLAHAAREGVALTGMSDHLVSEAIYLRDPDGHGIEIYADRPRGTWLDPATGELRMTTLPLDVDGLLAEAGEPGSAAFERLADGTVMGHVHLQVAHIADTVAFYRGVLGLDLMTAFGEQAAFLSAGGYHHHVGANTWAGISATPPPAGAAALRHATLVLADAAERDRVAARVADAGQDPVARPDGVLVRDPSHNALLLTSA